VLSYNLQGLCSNTRRKRAARYLKRKKNPPAIVCVQEHKLCLGKTHLLKADVWPEALFITAPALDGRNAARNTKVLGGKGSVALALHQNLKNYISGEGILPSKKGVWVTLEHPTLGDIAFMGVYAPNNSKARAELWKEIGTVADIAHRWCILGDFNMIEKQTDQKGGSLQTVHGAEKLAWNLMVRRLHLADVHDPDPGHLSYSWDSLQSTKHIPHRQVT
jgi:exonuclease III